MIDGASRSPLGARVPDGALPPEGPSPCVVVFVAGARARAEAPIRAFRELHYGRHVVFICEPEHRGWLAETPGDTVFTVDPPFNPFGRKAATILESLEGRPVEACAIVVAEIGLENLRFRVMALRVRTSRFVLLNAGDCRVLRQVGRGSFLRLAAATMFFRILVRLPGVHAIVAAPTGRARSSRGPGAWPSGAAVGLRLRHAGSAIAADLFRWLSPLDQPLALGLAILARGSMWWHYSHHSHGGKEIVHIIPSIGMGGAQRQLVLLLKTRSAAYHHRVVVIFSGDHFFAPEALECGVSVSYVGSQSVRSETERLPGRRPTRSLLRPILALAGDSFPVCREVVKLTIHLRTLDPQPDVVHCWLLFANIVGSIAARLVGVPLVITSIRNIHSQVAYNYYHEPRWQRALERATVPLASAIIANSQSVTTDYQAFAAAPTEKLITVPNGIEVQGLRPLPPEEREALRRSLRLGPGDFVVGTVARLAKEKDFETFLRAVELARRQVPSLRVIIAGDGLLRDDLETFAASLGLADLVQFLGGRKDAAALIQCYDVFLLTSIIEGMPNAIMESQLLGVPVVATSAGGTADLIRDGETGLLAPIRDHERLASGIVRLFADELLRQKISRAARDQILNGYTAERFVARTEDVYRLLTSKEAGSPCVG